MCGIAGIVDYQVPSEQLTGLARAMRAALRHRGPDGEGERLAPHVILEHTRLTIEDARGSAQPLVSPDGRCLLVYNGELFGMGQTRARLAREYPFGSENDAELVLAALTLEGPRALSYLDGMFALFFWDLEKQQGFAARDRMGVKPLVYAFERGRLRFASEAKALLASGTAPSLHLPSFLEWVVMPSLSGVEHGMFAGVDVLPPGHLLHVSREGIRRELFAGFEPGQDPVSEERLLDDLPRVVWTSLAAAADTRAPLGALLSGGLDSSLVAMAAQWHVEELPTFTAHYQDQESFDYSKSLVTHSDDTPSASAVAKALELPNTLVEIPRSGLAEDLAQIARVDDALPAWEQQVTQHHLFRAARQAVKVVLVGDAADETHFGYHFLLDPEASASPEGLMTRLGALQRRALLSPELREGSDLLADLAETYRGVVGARGVGWTAGTTLSRDERILATTSLVAKRWLPRLLHNGDIHSMAFGLEARVPFASGEILELAQHISPAVGMKDGIEKWHLRKAMQGELPDAIRWRRKSALPKDLRAEPVYRAEIARVLADPEPAVARYLDLSTVKTLVRQSAPLTEVERSILFQTLVFHHWSRHYGIR